MKKNRKLLIIVLVNIILFSIPIFNDKVNAKDNITYTENTEEDTEKLKEAYEESEQDLEGLYKYINKSKNDTEIMKDLNPEEYVKSYIVNGKGNISMKTLEKTLIRLIFKEVSSVLKIAMSIIVIAILSSLLKNMQDAFSNQGISEVAFYACYSILIVLLSKSFLVAIDVAKDVIYSITDFMAVVLPVLVTMIGLSGGVVESTMMDPIVMEAALIIPRIYTTFIIPLILIGFALQFANNLSKEHKITNLCNMVKKITLWSQGFIITVFIAILSIRGITASTLDAVAMKTTKFAIDNFVPIVGKSFSDAISSVAGYSLIIKNAVSGVGLLVIVLLITYPIIKIVSMIWIYRFSAALVEPISDKRMTSAISAASDSLVMLLSCVLSLSLMFFILIGIMASASKFVVGA